MAPKSASITDRLGCIERRELADRTITPGQASALKRLCEVSIDLRDWLYAQGYTDATNILWNLDRAIERLDD